MMIRSYARSGGELARYAPIFFLAGSIEHVKESNFIADGDLFAIRICQWRVSSGRL